MEDKNNEQCLYTLSVEYMLSVEYTQHVKKEHEKMHLLVSRLRDGRDRARDDGRTGSTTGSTTHPKAPPR